MYIILPYILVGVNLELGDKNLRRDEEMGGL